MRVSALLLDLDGVLYVEDEPIPGAAEAVAALRGLGLELRFVTNTTSRSRARTLEKLGRLGFGVSNRELVTPAALAVRHCRQRGHRRVALVMNDEVKADFDELEEVKAEADAVIIGDLGSAFGYEVLNRAFRLVMDGAELVALQKNRYWLAADGLSLDVGPHLSVPRIGLAGLVILLLGLGAGPARADESAEAAAALPARHVYVAPDAPVKLSSAAQEALRRQITDSGKPIFIADVPVGSDPPETVLRRIVSQTHRDGTYAVVAGKYLRVASDTLARGSVGALREAALTAHRREGPGAVLSDFVRRVASASTRRSDAVAPVAARSERGASSGLGVLGVLLLVLLVGGVAFAAVRFFRRRREQHAQLEAARQTASEDLAALGEDIRALDLDIEMPGADPRAKDDYGQAVNAYDQANGRVARARGVDDLAGVGERIADGRYAMLAAKERLAGREPPARRPPCFFDPRHGPSTNDVQWAPSGGAPRTVPACGACATRIADGIEPEARHVEVDGVRQPYWAAPPAFGGYYGGYFGGFGGGGLLTGLLLGEALGGGFGGFGGWGDYEAGYDQGQDQGDFGDGGDGGFDFGSDPGSGGDFGGGDFGGR